MLSMGKHDTCKMNCEICQDLYPFSNLYNIGLLGILYKNESNVDFEQRFLPIGKRITNANHIQLPQSDLFFLHPCLSDIAREKRKNNRRFYENTRHTIVGNTISCSTGAMERISADLKRWTDVWQGEKVFISSTVDDLTEERDALKSSLAKKGYYPVLSESPDFQYGGSQVFSHDHCIDEILKCKNMVLIIGKRYGGEYRGEKYKEYAEKIVELSGGKISAPSITLMEYFMARTKRLRYCVFIDNDVILYKNREGIGSAVKSRIGMQGTKDMDKAVEVFNFVNHAKISNSPTALGNWLFPYKSIEDIETVISNFSFEIMEA